MKIVQTETLISCGAYAASAEWKKTRDDIHAAVKKCDWPPGSGTFTIYPVKHANGVVPIKKEFLIELKKRGWTIEAAAKNKSNQVLGDFDALLVSPNGSIVAEWETGNISSSHRSMNKLIMLVATGVLIAGVLVVPSRKLYGHLTDRIGNITELEPYIEHWKTIPCSSGVVEIVVIEQDAESMTVRRIPKGKDGNAKKKGGKRKAKIQYGHRSCGDEFRMW